MNPYHVPVLFEEALQLLDIQADGVYVDLTFGGGGHSRGILARLSEKGSLYGFDQDADARHNAPADERFHFVEGNFRFMRGLLRERGVQQVDGVLADLGVSSHHFDAVERGFSFRGDAQLDMRMNQRSEFTAAQLIAEYPTQRLIAIFRDYGELPDAHKIAGRIVEARKAEGVSSTAQLIEILKPLIPRNDENRWLSKLFQALRIEVNGEMEALRMALEQSQRVLKPGGRLVVISYHSLEDRIVKNFMRAGEKDFYGRMVSPFEVITRKAIVPSAEEIEANPRSRSAKMRAAWKR